MRFPLLQHMPRCSSRKAKDFCPEYLKMQTHDHHRKLPLAVVSNNYLSHNLHLRAEMFKAWFALILVTTVATYEF